MSEFRYIQVKSADIRSTPSFLGKILFKLAYTKKVTLIKTKDSWMNISYNSKTGWVHQSALSVRAIYLDPKAAQAKAQVSDDEITLAGKGFNKEVEKKYRTKHGSKGFAAVDKAETIKMTAAGLSKFLQEGKLNPAGGKS